MNSKLYVGNLSYFTTEDALSSFFSKAGTVVSVDLIKDRISGRSKGFAFVVMSNLAEAEKAVEMFNGFNLDDSNIRVSLARRRDNRGSLSDPENGKSLHPIKRGRNKRA
jgi:RNA recognition motif-containing protein